MNRSKYPAAPPVLNDSQETPARASELLPEALEELQASLEELRTAEEELRQQNDALADARLGLETERGRYQSLFEFAPDAYLVTDLQGVIQEANQASARLFGVSTRYLTGKPFSFAVAEAERRTFRLSLLGAEHIRETQTWKMRLLRRHHGEFDAEITIGLIQGRENKPLGLRWLVRDATPRRVAEEAANRHGEELERRIATQKQEIEHLRTAYEQERRIAETLQNSLLRTTLPSAVPGLKFATLYQPASYEAQVGGDFFDVFTVDGGKVALAVGDISGKGLAAAACTAEVKYALRAFMRQRLDPAQAMRLLNDFFCEARRQSDWEHEIYATLALALMEPATGEVQFATAGAEPPLLWRSDGTVETVETSGLLLGIEPNREYPQFQRQMAPNDTLLMLTDGITEARQNREFFGLDGVSTVLQTTPKNPSLEETGAAIVQAAKQFAAGTLQDDVCLLMACREEA